MKKTLSLVLALTLVLALGFLMPASAEYTKLTWLQGTGADAPKDNALVLEAMNKITREKLGVEVQIDYMKGDQVNLSIQSGQVYDMYFTCDWFNDFNTRVSEGIFADITEKLKTVTPALYASLPEQVWDLSAVNGKIYAIPVKKDYCPQIFFIYDKGFYDSIGITWPEKLTDINEITPFLKAFKEKNKDVYPIMITKGGVGAGIDGTFNFVSRDSWIGFNYDLVTTDPANASKVISMLDDPTTVGRMKTYHEWYKAGYINPDAATTENISEKLNYLKINQCWIGYDYSPAYGYTCGQTLISGPYLSTSGIQGSMNAFSVTLEDNPERFDLALKYQELVNTDREFRDMLRYGIPGTHFNYQEDGSVIRTQAGKDNYAPWAFSQGSYELSSIETSEGVKANLTQWVDTFKSYEGAVVAVNPGFAFNPDPVKMEVAAVSAVKEKYSAQLYTGTIDPETAIPKIKAEMVAAGLDKIIAEAQAQVDAFLAAKK